MNKLCDKGDVEFQAVFARTNAIAGVIGSDGTSVLIIGSQVTPDNVDLAAPRLVANALTKPAGV